MIKNYLLVGVITMLLHSASVNAAMDYMNPSAEFLHLKNFSRPMSRVTEDEMNRMKGLPVEPYPSKSKKFWYNLYHNQWINSSAPFGMQEMDLTKHPRADETKTYRRWKDPYPGYNADGQYVRPKEYPRNNP